MPVLHEELWTYHDKSGTDARVFRKTATEGVLQITQPDRPAFTLLVHLSPDSPTEEDDRDWFTTVLNYITP